MITINNRNYKRVKEYALSESGGSIVDYDSLADGIEFNSLSARNARVSERIYSIITRVPSESGRTHKPNQDEVEPDIGRSVVVEGDIVSVLRGLQEYARQYDPSAFGVIIMRGKE